MPKEIIEMLGKLSFVQWDRYTSPLPQHEYHIYGWMDRAKDTYKDFVVLSYVDGDFWFITSSAEKSQEMTGLIGGEDEAAIDHCPCSRVEDVADIPNVIRL